MEISLLTPISIYLTFFFIAWIYMIIHIVIEDYSHAPIFENVLRTAFIGVLCLGYPILIAHRIIKWVSHGK